MTTGDWIAAASAAISVVTLMFTVRYARKADKASRAALHASRQANQDAERANQISMAQAETQLRAEISSTRTTVGNLSLEVIDLLNGRDASQVSPSEAVKLKQLATLCKAEVENNLNAYENACRQYREGRMDKESFKRTYFSEIQKLCEGQDSYIRDLMFPAETSRYKAIWAVYREWYDHERRDN